MLSRHCHTLRLFILYTCVTAGLGMSTAWSLVRAEISKEFEEKVSHHYAQNGDTSIHYASLGEGPLLVFIHGFPDFWYSWREQMQHLSAHYRTIALDQRGYNRSGQPEGTEQYKVQHLVDDVRAVIKHTEEKKAIVVGHDWGGFVAWNFAMTYPKLTDKLIILNLPHPVALSRELAHNEKQQENSQYARNFQKQGAHHALTAEGLAAWVEDQHAKKRYVEAFKRSNFESMLHFYKANYPRPPYQEHQGPIVKVMCPVLMFHGLDDWALLPDGLNKTWDFLENDLTLITLPGAGHFVQQDRSRHVSLAIENWLHLQKALSSTD